MENLKKILDNYIEHLPSKKKYKEYFIAFKWKDIVGEEIAKHIQPSGIKFHTLFLTSDSPTWAHEIKYLEEKIIEKINLFAAQKIITEIKFSYKQKNYQFEQNKKENTVKNIEKIEPNLEEKAQARLFFKRKDRKEIKNADEEKLAKLNQKLEHIYANMLAKKRLALEAGEHKCKNCQNLCKKEEEICFSCREKNKAQIRQKIREYLSACPWAKYGEISNYVQADPRKIESVRLDLLNEWAKKVIINDTTSMNAKKLVMLYKSLKPEELTEEIIKKNLHKLRFDIIHLNDKSIFQKNIKKVKNTHSLRRKR